MEEQIVQGQLPQTESKKKSRFLAILLPVAAVLLVAVILAGLFFGGVFSKSRAESFRKIQSEFMLGGSNSFLSGTSEKTELTVPKKMELSVNSDMEGFTGDIRLEVLTDLLSEEKLGQLTFSMLGNELFSGTVVEMKDGIGFYFPTLDANYYTIQYDAVKNLLGSDSELSLTEEELKALLEEYQELFFSTVTDENVTESRETVHLEGLEKEIKGTVYTFKPKEEDLKAMLLRLADELEQDQKIRELYTVVSDFGKAAGGTEEPDYGELIAALRTHAADIAKTVTESGFTWKTVVSKDRIYLQEISIEQNGERTGIAYESFGEGKTERRDLIRFFSPSQNLKMENRFVDDGTTVTGDITVGYDSMSLKADYEFTPGKRSELSIPYGTVHFSLQGIAFDIEVAEDGTGSKHVLTLTSEGEKLTIALNTSNEAVTITKPDQDATDLSGYTEEELETLLQTALQNFYMNLMQVS